MSLDTRFPGSATDLESASVLGPHLRESLAIAEQACTIVRSTVDLFQEITPEAPWADCQAILATRISDDVRVAAGLVLRGYFTQAMTLGSAVYELAFTGAYISIDNERATTWLEWDELDRTPWPRRKMVSEVQIRVYGSDASTHADGRYMGLCWGKHGNPRLMRALGAASTAEAHVLNIDPALGGKAHRLGELALWSMLGPVLTYLAGWHQSDLFPEEDLERLLGLLERWSPFDRRMWPRS